jgi:hypothetical protein
MWPGMSNREHGQTGLTGGVLAMGESLMTAPVGTTAPEPLSARSKAGLIPVTGVAWVLVYSGDADGLAQLQTRQS